MFSSRPIPVVGGLVLQPNGRRFSTGKTPTTAQQILKLGASVSDSCDIKTLWTRDFTELPGFGRLCLQLFFDDSCLLKNLPTNAFVPALAGDVILTCSLDVYKLDKNHCCEDEALCHLPVLELFTEKSIDALLKAGPASNQLELSFDRDRVKAEFRTSSLSKWGKVYACDGTTEGANEHDTQASAAAAATGSGITTAAPQQQPLEPTQRQDRQQRKAGSDFAANLAKAFGSS